MEVHPDKCSVVRISRKKTIHRYPYTLHGQILTDTKYLGVTRADNMMWNAHIEETAAKGNKKHCFLKINLKINNPNIKIHTYKTLFRPTPEYCSTVWDTLTAKAAFKLEIVQYLAARWVKNDYVQHEFSHPDVHRPQVAGHSPEMNRRENLTDVRNSPQRHPDRSNNIC